MTQRELARDARQQIQADHRNPGNRNHGGQVERVAVGHQRKDRHQGQRDRRPNPFHRVVREDDEPGVVFLERSAAHHTLSIRRTPNRPYGLTISTTTIMANPITSFMPRPR